MHIKQFRYGDTNLSYLLWSEHEAAAIDGGAVEEILAFVNDNGLDLKYVLNTHEHWDHIPGNEALLDASSAEFVKPADVCKRKFLALGNEKVEAFPVPGHTEDSIVFSFNCDTDNQGCFGSLITGDTLFNGTVGNCYTKKYEMYFESLNKILDFPPETLIYAGHDIFDYALGVIDGIDPDNPRLKEYKGLYSREMLFTSLEIEKAVNPFIRFNDPALDEYRKKLNMPLNTPYERFRAMMSIH